MHLFKTSRRSWTTPTAIVIGLAGALAAGVLMAVGWRQPASTTVAPETVPEIGGLRSGDPAPEFAVPGLAGGQVTLTQYAGHPRVVSFFASWCESCWNDLGRLTNQRHVGGALRG